MVIEINSIEVNAVPLPSATVMVLRDGARGPEVLMVRRHGNSGVLGGVHVFPGGKLDEQDSQVDPAALDQPLAALHHALNEPELDSSIAAGLHVAALRETFEECGLWLGSAAEPALLQQAREQMKQGQAFASTLLQLGLRLETSNLVPWSRWITPRVPSVTNKRFDTRFFVAQAPQGQEASHDNHEATETVWLDPREALTQYWEGVIDLAPPQIMSLHQLAHFARVSELLASARVNRPVTVQPEPFDQDGQRVICYPGDPRHSVRERAWAGPTRLTYRNRRFEAEGGLAALLPPR